MRSAVRALAGWLLPPPTTAAAGSPAAGAAATSAPRPAATGTGGGTVPTTLPQTGEARAPGMSRIQMIVPVGGVMLVIVGMVLLMRRRTATTRT